MAALPHPYDAYWRLQQQSRKRTQIDDEYWGTDAALEALLALPSFADAETVNVERVAQSAARKERHRTTLRAIHLASEDPGDSDAGYRAIEACQVLRLVAQEVPNDDWTLLQSVAEGASYTALANRRGVSAGSLRVRVSRIRRAVVTIAT